MKKLVNPNVRFIWGTLMSDRGRKLAIGTLGTVLLGAAVQTAAPYGIGLIASSLLEKKEEALITGILVYFGIEFLGSVIGWFRMRIRERLSQDNFWHIPRELTRRFLRRPLIKLTGEDSEIDGGGVESVKDKVWNVVDTYIFSVFPNYSLALFSIIACSYVLPLAGAFVLVYFISDLLIGNRQNAYIQKEMRPVVAEFRRWERRIREWWHATPLVKQNGVERRIIKQVEDEVQPTLEKDDKIWRQLFPFMVLGRRTFGQIAAGSLYTVMGLAVMKGEVTVAGFMLLVFSFQQMRVVLENINDHNRVLGRHLASIDKYREILEAPVPFRYDEGVTFTDQQIGITLSDVSLSLGEGNERREILRRVNLTIKPGEKVGIVGPSGAGKSQLVNLILRGTDPDKGVVYVNDKDLRTLSLESFLRFCGIIPQKSDLFEDSVRGNVMFGVSALDQSVQELPSTVDERIWRALKKAGLDFSNRLTKGLDTQVGYKGMRLSGGQQARMRIADAHFKLAEGEDRRPRLIVADEPTASLDSLSEMTVMEHLTDALPPGTTVLMIAHRLSTVMGMDRIMFVRPLSDLKEGEEQVTMHGSLGELYTEEALFREMADAQNFKP